MMSGLRSHLLSLVLMIVAIFAGSIGAYWLVRTPGARPAAEAVRMPVTGERDQLVFVFFGLSTCSVCQLPETFAAIPEVKASLARLAEQNGLDFASIGVAFDYEIETGVGYLGQLGKWDQISVGLEQLNSVALHTMPVNGTPNLLVVRRNVSTTAGGPRRLTTLTAQKVLVHKTGIGEIRRWLAHGTPIPGLEVDMR